MKPSWNWCVNTCPLPTQAAAGLAQGVAPSNITFLVNVYYVLWFSKLSRSTKQQILGSPYHIWHLNFSAKLEIESNVQPSWLSSFQIYTHISSYMVGRVHPQGMIENCPLYCACTLIWIIFKPCVWKVEVFVFDFTKLKLVWDLPKYVVYTN